MMMHQVIFRDPGGSDPVRIIYNTVCPNGSVLIVPPDTTAFFSCNGVMSEPYLPGSYEINTGLNPFFVRLRNLMTAGDPAIYISVFFVATGRRVTLTAGTGDFVFAESKYKITMHAAAAYTTIFYVSKPRILLERMVGMHGAFTDEDFNPVMNSIIQGPIRQALTKKLMETPYYQVQSNLIGLGISVTGQLRESYNHWGLTLEQVTINSININEKDIEKLNRLEEIRAEGTIKIDVEKDELKRIYGDDLGRRTSVRATENFTSNPGMAGNPGAMLAALPTALYLGERLLSGVRPDLDNLMRGRDIFRENQNEESSRTSNQEQQEPPPPRVRNTED